MENSKIILFCAVSFVFVSLVASDRLTLSSFVPSSEQTLEKLSSTSAISGPYVNFGIKRLVPSGPNPGSPHVASGISNMNYNIKRLVPSGPNQMRSPGSPHVASGPNHESSGSPPAVASDNYNIKRLVPSGPDHLHNAIVQTSTDIKRLVPSGPDHLHNAIVPASSMG